MHLIKRSRLPNSIFRRDSGETTPQPSACGDIHTLPKLCVSIINDILLSLIDNDISGVYRIYRSGNAILKNTRASITGCQSSDSTSGDLYLKSLCLATELILEICREIASTNGLPLYQRCELDILRHDMSDIGNHDTARLSQSKDFITHAITEHIMDMDENSWNDTHHAYQYLRLLQNLRSIIICYGKLINPVTD